MNYQIFNSDDMAKYNPKMPANIAMYELRDKLKMNGIYPSWMPLEEMADKGYILWKHAMAAYVVIAYSIDYDSFKHSKFSPVIDYKAEVKKWWKHLYSEEQLQLMLDDDYNEYITNIIMEGK